jgi:glutaminase
VYLASTADQTHSSRQRNEVEETGLCRSGNQIAVCGVEGDLEFADMEALVHSLGKVPFVGSVRWIALDLHRITRLHSSATPILRSLVAEVLAREVTLVLADPDHRIGGEVAAVRFPSLDEALGWCEDQLLAEIGTGGDGGARELPIEVEATSVVTH